MEHSALVTGGSRGIGAGISKRLRDDGFKVIIADQIDPQHEQFDEFIRVDLSDPEAIWQKVRPVVQNRTVTRLINNAGIVNPASLEDVAIESVDPVVDVNLKAPILCAQLVLPAMKAAGEGRIVNISSRVALGKENRTVYAATKAGMHGVTKTWALELGQYGITVNAIGPGPIQTELFDKVNPPEDPKTSVIVGRIPVGRLGAVEDIADAVSFFASKRSGFVTGQVLYVCGGMTIGSI